MIWIVSLFLRPFVRRAWLRIPFDERVAGTNTAFWFVVIALGLAFLSGAVAEALFPMEPRLPAPELERVADFQVSVPVVPATPSARPLR